MRFLIYILLLFSTTCFAGQKDYQPLFNKLITLSGVHSVDKRVKVVIDKSQDNQVGTYADWSGIVYLSIRDVIACGDNDSCIAFIVAHEIGHHALGHTRGNMYDRKQWEIDADSYAIKLTKAAGYSPCEGAVIFTRMMTAWGDIEDETHPKFSIRINNINKECRANIGPVPKPWSKKKEDTANVAQ